MKTIIEEGEPPIRASRAPRPTVKPRDRERALQIKTILVPLDFSRASMQVLKYAIALGEKFKAAIHLVHVQPADELTAISRAGGLVLNCADAIALMQDRLSEVQRKQGRFWPDNCHVVSGRPFEEITQPVRFWLCVRRAVILSRCRTEPERSSTAPGFTSVRGLRDFPYAL